MPRTLVSSEGIRRVSITARRARMLSIEKYMSPVRRESWQVALNFLTGLTAPCT